MEAVHARCAGLDISKKDAVQRRGVRPGRRRWAPQDRVVLEATGDYRKPFYHLLEDARFELVLVNARPVKTLPGRKTDEPPEVELPARSCPATCRRARRAEDSVANASTAKVSSRSRYGQLWRPLNVGRAPGRLRSPRRGDQHPAAVPEPCRVADRERHPVRARAQMQGALAEQAAAHVG